MARQHIGEIDRDRAEQQERGKRQRQPMQQQRGQMRRPALGSPGCAGDDGAWH